MKKLFILSFIATLAACGPTSQPPVEPSPAPTATPGELGAGPMAAPGEDTRDKSLVVPPPSDLPVDKTPPQPVN